MFVYGSISGKVHIKRRAFYNNERLLFPIDNKLINLNFKNFLLIDDFEVVITIPKKTKCKIGANCYFYSKSYGLLSSFPWWDNVDKDIRNMKENDIPCGTLDKPYDDLEQGWQILIFRKRDYVYVLEGNEPCCKDFPTWYKVRMEHYYNQWKKIIREY